MKIHKLLITFMASWICLISANQSILFVDFDRLMGCLQGNDQSHLSRIYSIVGEIARQRYAQAVVTIRIAPNYFSSYSQILYLADPAQDITQEVIDIYVKEAAV